MVHVECTQCIQMECRMTQYIQIEWSDCTLCIQMEWSKCKFVRECIHLEFRERKLLTEHVQIYGKQVSLWLCLRRIIWTQVAHSNSVHWMYMYMCSDSSQWYSATENAFELNARNASCAQRIHSHGIKKEEYILNIMLKTCVHVYTFLYLCLSFKPSSLSSSINCFVL